MCTIKHLINKMLRSNCPKSVGKSRSLTEFYAETKAISLNYFTSNKTHTSKL